MPILSPGMVPGFTPMSMDIPRMKDQGAQNAMNLKLLMAALKPTGGQQPGAGPMAANTGMPGGGYAGPGGETQPGPGFYPGMGGAGGGMVNQTGGIAGLLSGAGAGGGAMGMLGKLLQKKPPLDPNAVAAPAVDPMAAGGLDASGGVGGMLGW